MHVLVVEDSELLRGYLDSALRHLGHTCSSVGSAEETCEALARGDASFDLLLIDVGLPDIDGLTLAARLRAEGQTMPVVFTTGGTGNPMLASVDSRAILAKPFSLEALELALCHAMASK